MTQHNVLLVLTMSSGLFVGFMAGRAYGIRQCNKVWISLAALSRS